MMIPAASQVIVNAPADGFLFSPKFKQATRGFVASVAGVSS